MIETFAIEYLTVYEMMQNEISHFSVDHKYRLAIKKVLEKRITPFERALRSDTTGDSVVGGYEDDFSSEAQDTVSRASQLVAKMDEPLRFAHVVHIAVFKDILHATSKPIPQHRSTAIASVVATVVPFRY